MLAGDYRTLCLNPYHLISAVEEAGDGGTSDGAIAYLKDI